MSKTLELTIDDLGAQGDGIAHLDGQAIFVAGGLTGERVCVEPTKEPQRAKLLNLITSSPERAEPPCPHFPQCGGCRLQHLETNAYTKWKVGQLKQMLSQANIDVAVWQEPFITLPATRRRARLAAKRKGNEITLGFNEWRSHNLVDVKSCSVLLPEITAFIQKLRDKLSLWLPDGKECDVQITALSGGFDVVLIGGPGLELNERMDLAMLAEQLDIAKLSWRKWDRSPFEPVSHRKPLSVIYGDTIVPFPPGSFLQATTASEKALVDFALKAVGDSTKILDLFCGLGGFGLSLPQAKHVECADLDGPAIQALGQAVKSLPRYKVRQRNLMNDPYTAHECDAFDAVIFDPPRGGAKAQSERLAESNVRHIVAISCDPTSFVRDAKILMQGGYRLQSLLPVDQFLWSTHTELAAHFTR